MSEALLQFTVAEGKVFALTAASKGKSALAKRGGDSWFINADFTQIPPRVMEALAIEAVQAKVRAAVKKLDPATATKESVEAAMAEAYANLCSGTKAKRTQSDEAKIRAEARTSIRNQIKELNYGEAEIDKTELNAEVKAYFDAHAEYAKTQDPELEFEAQIVEDALSAARARFAEQKKLDEKMKKLHAKRLAAAKQRLSEQPTAEPVPSKRPTPTQRVNQQKKNPPQGGRSA